jgi:hypothetical protein
MIKENLYMYMLIFYVGGVCRHTRRARWGARDGLRLEKQLHMFHLRQELLLQAIDGSMRHLYRAVLGMRVRLYCLPADLVRHSYHAYVHDLLWVRTEVLWNLRQLLSGTDLRYVRSLS